MITQAWDYYASNHGLNGMNGNNDPVRVRADITNFNNAGYTPVGNHNTIKFGYYNNIYLALIDVAGHEFTHGVDQHSAGLFMYGQSGALDESYADIFGFMIERYAEGGISDWLHGEDGNLGQTVIRSLEDPNSWGTSYAGPNNCTQTGGQPDTYFGTFYYTGVCDQGGVHVNSGVQNFWFHLLAMGGSGTNDFSTPYNISAIGVDDAAEIAFLAHTFLQSAGAYPDARAASIMAAILIYGDCSFEHIQTTNAWAAVGVGTQSNCNPASVSKEAPTRAPLLYPNPASTSIMIKFGDTRNRSLSLYSMNGSLIDVFETNSNTSAIDISNLSDGLYLIAVNEGGKVHTLKFVKE